MRDIGAYFQSRFGGERASTSNSLRSEPSEGAPRLALLDPRARSIEILEGARPGSLPTDWSADRQRLLFTQIIDGYPQLFEMDMSNRHVRPVTREPGAHPWGCYGPDGRIVAETVRVEARVVISRLVVSDPGGANFRRLTDGPAHSRPDCSAGRRRGGVLLGATRRRGGRPRQVAGAHGEIRDLGPGIDPSFTPDGRYVVYSSATRVNDAGILDERWRLRRARVAGVGRSGVQPGPNDEYEPSVSPDGRIIAYVGVRPRVSTDTLRAANPRKRRADPFHRRSGARSGVVARPRTSRGTPDLHERKSK